MELYYHKEISEIENCPLNNYEKDLVLFRYIQNEIVNVEDLMPKAANPKNKKMQGQCNCWGLSTFNNIGSLINSYKLMNAKLQARFTHIAKITVDKEFGIKYQSGNDLCHFTVFPYLKDDVLSNFVTIQKL